MRTDNKIDYELALNIHKKNILQQVINKNTRQMELAKEDLISIKHTLLSIIDQRVKTNG
jgi:hypothetical protein